MSIALIEHANLISMRIFDISTKALQTDVIRCCSDSGRFLLLNDTVVVKSGGLNKM